MVSSVELSEGVFQSHGCKSMRLNGYLVMCGSAPCSATEEYLDHGSLYEMSGCVPTFVDGRFKLSLIGVSPSAPLSTPGVNSTLENASLYIACESHLMML